MAARHRFVVAEAVVRNGGQVVQVGRQNAPVASEAELAPSGMIFRQGFFLMEVVRSILLRLGQGSGRFPRGPAQFLLPVPRGVKLVIAEDAVGGGQYVDC